MKPFACTLMVPVCAIVLLSACDAGQPETIGADDIDRIETSLVNGSALRWELTQAEARVATECMEDQGFFAHETNLLHGGIVPHRFEGFASPYSRIPTVEQAEQFGFGQWVELNYTPESASMREDLNYLAYVAGEQGWMDMTSLDAYQEWKESGEEYQTEWLAAFLGEERAEAPAGKADQLPFGGCELVTIEAVYGEPAVVETESGTYLTRPDLNSPLTWVGDGELYRELSAQYAEQEEGFLDCVEDRGYGAWQFDEMGMLPVREQLAGMYSDASESDDPMAYEFAMAKDFAECAQDSGLRDEAEEAWAMLYVDRLIDREAEIFAWEQQVADYLASAQEYLA
ncbi:hypothetical protein [Glycomyces algeriensis]|uniref:hypothetical protein n=1 Tax=Glycomyces algeriensis TaxID=256037 RepID=UPI0022CFD177|nr:hypothetical protein [Glycomyces algeriensis]MDA1364658.1 hypothetical protein [Glycomyces algeriensis]MDR7350696.1 hypothetical protein [Glycomyces algeriensis]